MNDPSEPSSPSGFMRNIKYAGTSEGGSTVDCVHPVKGEVYYAYTLGPAIPLAAMIMALINWFSIFHLFRTLLEELGDLITMEKIRDNAF